MEGVFSFWLSLLDIRSLPHLYGSCYCSASTYLWFKDEIYMLLTTLLVRMGPSCVLYRILHCSTASRTSCSTASDFRGSGVWWCSLLCNESAWNLVLSTRRILLLVLLLLLQLHLDACWLLYVFVPISGLWFADIFFLDYATQSITEITKAFAKLQDFGKSQKNFKTENVLKKGD